MIVWDMMSIMSVIGWVILLLHIGFREYFKIDGFYIYLIDTIELMIKYKLPVIYIFIY
jgi:hypothetical protein